MNITKPLQKKIQLLLLLSIIGVVFAAKTVIPMYDGMSVLDVFTTTGSFLLNTFLPILAVSIIYHWVFKTYFDVVPTKPKYPEELTYYGRYIKMLRLDIKTLNTDLNAWVNNYHTNDKFTYYATNIFMILGHTLFIIGITELCKIGFNYLIS